MEKRAFLKPLSVLLAALSSAISNSSEATPAPTAASEPTQDATHATVPAADNVRPLTPGEARSVITRSEGNLYRFVLQRTQAGELVAQHYSHMSHESHASHASHRSHYSGS